jgi:hypothetical protein
MKSGDLSFNPLVDGGRRSMIQLTSLKVGDYTLRGVIHQPEKTPAPCVILFHGFTGSKQESSFLFTKLSRRLEKEGIGAIRFDFSGSGDSDGEFQDMTFGGEVEEASAILHYARTLDWIDPNRISLLGFSMGGAVATQVAKRFPDQIEKLGLWAPAGLMNQKASIYYQPDRVRADGTVDLGGLLLGRAFYEELKDWDLFKGIDVFKGPVRILHGTKDETVPLEVGKRYLEIYENVSLIPISGANHVFSNVDWQTILLNETVSFFKQ